MEMTNFHCVQKSLIYGDFENIMEAKNIMEV